MTVFYGFPPPPEPNVIISYLVFVSGPLNPGESVVCETDLSLSPNLRESLDIFWVASGGVADPDPDNNLVRTPIFLPVTAIPTLSQYSLVVFAIALIGAAFFLRRRW